MTMKSTELMVGDWVRLQSVDYANGVIRYVEENKRVTVDHLSRLEKQESKIVRDDNIYAIHIEPIELTSEILQKTGFSKGEYNEKRFGEWIQNNVYSLLLENGDQVVSLDFCNGKIELEIATNAGRCLTIANVRYVHELQHALNLCEINKTVEL